MNKKKALMNIITSTIFKVIILIISILLRRYLLKYIGSEAVGLFSLYTSIIGFLAIAEIGIGAAITFSMYKPIVNDDKDKISGFYHLYNKIYKVILVVIAVVGFSLVPLLPRLAKGNTNTFNIYLTYSLYLLSTLITYLYAHKTSFINAHLDNYITIAIRSIGVIIETILQIVLIILIGKKMPIRAFNIFMVILIISNIFQWIATSIIHKKRYSKLINGNKELSKEDKRDVIKRTGALFFHKIGGTLVNTTDSLIISAVLSVTLLGIYSNYITIVTGMYSILVLMFTSITSVIGHSYAKNTKEQFYRQFKYLYVLNYIIGFIFYLGFYAIVDGLILTLFLDDASLLMSNKEVIVITISYFIVFMRRTVLSFRDASGTFYHDRYKPLIVGVTNLILSLILVKVWGVVGVLIATIFTNMAINNIVEPYVLYKHGFNKNPKGYYLYNYIGIGLFVIAIIVFNMIPLKDFNNIYINFLVRGFLSVGVSILFLTIIYIINKSFRESFNYLVKTSISFIKEKIKRKRNV